MSQVPPEPASNAPLADRVDHEQLQVCQVGAEPEADQRREQPGEATRIAGRQGRGEQDYIAGDSEDGDVDAEEVRIRAVGDRLTTAAACDAKRVAAA
jgi:hypothetical protein